MTPERWADNHWILYSWVNCTDEISSVTDPQSEYIHWPTAGIPKPRVLYYCCLGLNPTWGRVVVCKREESKEVGSKKIWYHWTKIRRMWPDQLCLQACKHPDLSLDLWLCSSSAHKATTRTTGSCRHFSGVSLKGRLITVLGYSFHEMLFDVLICFLRRSLHCLPRPHLFSKLNHVGHNNNAAVRSLAAAHIVLLSLSLSLSRSLSLSLSHKFILVPSFHSAALSIPPSCPEIQKEMSLQLGKGKMLQGPLFALLKHDTIRGEGKTQHRGHFHFHFHIRGFSHRAPCTVFPSYTWIISPDRRFEHAEQQKTSNTPPAYAALFLACLITSYCTVTNLRV